MSALRCDAGTLLAGDRIRYDIDGETHTGIVDEVATRYDGWAEIELVDADTGEPHTLVVPAQREHEVLT